MLNYLAQSATMLGYQVEFSSVVATLSAILRRCRRSVPQQPPKTRTPECDPFRSASCLLNSSGSPSSRTSALSNSSWLCREAFATMPASLASQAPPSNPFAMWSGCAQFTIIASGSAVSASCVTAAANVVPSANLPSVSTTKDTIAGMPKSCAASEMPIASAADPSV